MAAAELNTETQTEIQLISAASVSIEPIRWLWPGFLPSGKLTVLAGPGGMGKSTIAYDLAARVTTGSKWPDGSVGCHAGNVLIWTAEDDPKDMLVPRLMAANADLRRIDFPSATHVGDKKRPFDPSRDLEILYRQLRDKRGDIRFLLIDPIISAVSGDPNQANDVRRSLYPLVEIAEEFDIAPLGITHFAKSPDSKPRDVTDSVLGSQAFTALPRMVWVANWSQKHDSLVMAKTKANIAPPGGIEYSIQPHTVHHPKSHIAVPTVRVVWGGEVQGSSNAIFKREKSDEKEPSKAETFLARQLSGGKPRLATELEKLAQAEGIRPTQLSYAKRKKLPVEDGKLDGKHSYWWISAAEAEQCTATPS